MLVSLPAMNYYSSWDGIVMADHEQLHTPEADSQLASTVQKLLQDHDADGGASSKPTWRSQQGDSNHRRASLCVRAHGQTVL